LPLHDPLQQSELVAQNAVVGWQQSDWQVPATQLALQQSASIEQDCPASAHVGRQVPLRFCKRAPAVAVPGVPSPEPFVAVTRNQYTPPGGGVSVIVPDVVVIANDPSSHDSTDGFNRHGKLARSPR
jgi:hypothetical protein